MEQQRGTWASPFGFLMAAIGSAVGLGNLWGFSYKMGSCGGFSFLLLYLVFGVLVGLAVMLAELALGRKSRRGAVGAYRALGRRYSWIGYMGVFSGFLVLSFYAVLGGIVLRYVVAYFLNLLGQDGFLGWGADFFWQFLQSPLSLVLYFVIFMLLNLAIVTGGVSGGIEKFSQIAMPALFFLLLGVIVFVLTRNGAGEGIKFMFVPGYAVSSGIVSAPPTFFEVVKTAAGQMFFSLSLGMGCMITYGSYLKSEENLLRSTVVITVADTVIALMAGLAIMPACAAFGVDYGTGPGLLFVSMQTVFHNMGGVGNLVGFGFYFLVLIAAITSSISLLEVCTTFVLDHRLDCGRSPKRMQVTCGAAAVACLMGLPVALDGLGGGNGVLPSPYAVFGLAADQIKTWCASWLDLYDCLAEGILMPLGALLMTVLIGWIFGTDLVENECRLGGRTFVAKPFFRLCYRIVVPAGMILILFTQISAFF